MTIAVKNSLDIENPPPDCRLAVSVLAANYSIAARDMAAACGISVAALADIITRNQWPQRPAREQIEGHLRALFMEHGASPEHVDTLFHAHVKRAGLASSATQAPAADSTAGNEERKVLLPKQTLTAEAKKAFKLFLNPFDGEVMDEGQMFVNQDIALIRETCIQAAMGSRFMALVGESGAGKTTIQNDLEARISKDSRRAVIIKPSVLGMEDHEGYGRSVRSADILAAIITTLDSQAVVPNSIQARSLQAQKLLAAGMDAGYLHLLLIEEAHAMPDESLRHLKRLHEMRRDRRPMLGILLLAQPELAAKLDPQRLTLREVAQRCEIVILPPLGNSMAAYLEHRARYNDRELADFIDQSGLDEMRNRLVVTRHRKGGAKVQASMLYPLAINNLITGALNMAATLGVPVVNADVVRAV